MTEVFELSSVSRAEGVPIMPSAERAAWEIMESPEVTSGASKAVALLIRRLPNTPIMPTSDRPLATRDARHFARVKGLRLVH